jgi:hypothetical protein
LISEREFNILFKPDRDCSESPNADLAFDYYSYENLEKAWHR